jgi:Lrp/AsnC family transcriptional regulator for asnA, asnC and gidA
LEEFMHLDELDVRIVGRLQENGRRTTAEISRIVGVSQSTVKNRMDRLLQNGAVKVLAVINPEQLGFPVDVFIGINTDPDKAIQVGNVLLKLPQVYWVGHMTGRYDILVEVALRDPADLFEFVARQIGPIPGVRSTETALVMHQTKWRPAEWRLPDRDGRGAGQDHNHGGQTEEP